MPTRNVNLTEELDSFVSAKVASGRYGNASDVVRASLRALEREERLFEAVHAALEDGENSGIAADGVAERVRSRLDLLAQR